MGGNSAPPSNSRNKSAKSQISLVLSCILALIFAFGYLVYGVGWLGGGMSLAEDAATEMKAQQAKETFTIRHLFHHNTGEKHLTHRRLDLTPELLESEAFSTSNVETIAQYGAEEEDQTALSLWFADQSPWSKPLSLKSDSMTIMRLVERAPDFVESYLAYALEVGSQGIAGIHLDWAEEEDVPIPNVTDKQTVVSLALMASNAYVKIPGKGDWQDVGQQWNDTDGFGWMDDGIRGHVFANEDNSTIVVAIKGTSATGLTGGTDSETSISDKVNDNLLFSCCCARVSYMWQTVCDCYESSYTCNQKCLEKEMKREDRYYRAAMDIYRNVSSLYPDANIWLTGHSLGGALSSLVGRTYGLPTVTFQAPGELLATRRLHLPMPPGIPTRMEHIWHFGHTADPIFMGVCNGASSTCAVAGYAMETQCHSGKVCVYDVVTDLGWHVSITNHRIHTVIDNVLLEYNTTAQCVIPPPCHDCYNWNFIVGDEDQKKKTTTTRHTSTSSTSSESATPTDPADCLKRTWYGRCIKWADGKSSREKPSATSTSNTKTSNPSSALHKNSTLVTRTITKSSSVIIAPTATSHTPDYPDSPKKCVEYSWLGYCKRYEGDE
ncbi:unnamed protein product [Kuraishia capsulata CBS 1993]|uniref:Putative lipase ATG15 n=1 Tax=Kuraishia capsulata CBS 1993 TaxID=1382522 RepID=W6MQH2_9ASCO|nr:uncharacterized protein KUCA_T00004980001 [Kuraishia capsulata CBS 1993]CDK28994.1 unnamed protein product [Kuraishia capsulata CBS 1993]